LSTESFVVVVFLSAEQLACC